MTVCLCWWTRSVGNWDVASPLGNPTLLPHLSVYMWNMTVCRWTRSVGNWDVASPFGNPTLLLHLSIYMWNMTTVCWWTRSVGICDIASTFGNLTLLPNLLIYMWNVTWQSVSVWTGSMENWDVCRFGSPYVCQFITGMLAVSAVLSLPVYLLHIEMHRSFVSSLGIDLLHTQCY